MNNGERCSNCIYYPFCRKCAGPLAWCENWKKRNLGRNRKEKNESTN